MGSDGAYVSYTKLVAPWHGAMMQMTRLGKEIFAMHDIEIKGKKTELLTINPTHIDDIDYGGSLIGPQAADKASRIMGVRFAADGTAKATAPLATKETDTICNNILLRKQVTDRQCIFIINSVLIPRLLC